MAQRNRQTRAPHPLRLRCVGPNHPSHIDTRTYLHWRDDTNLARKETRSHRRPARDHHKDQPNLDLGVNKLSSIKPGFGALRKLKVLRLNSNWTNKLNVTNLWNELDQLSDLHNLQLWPCQSVTSIPGNIYTLSKLQELDVDNNLLVDLPESLFTMTHLKKLRVSTNKSPTATTDRLVAALPSTKVVL
jgi:Leucine-rich repeat (LRR) protein